jgi:hypothetical protein
MVKLLIKVLRLPFAGTRYLGSLLLAFVILYHFGLGHSGRIADLPNGKTVYVCGWVLDAPQAKAGEPADGGSGSGVCKIEDLLGFVDSVWPSESTPVDGSFVLIRGRKWDVDGEPVVKVEREVWRY